MSFKLPADIFSLYKSADVHIDIKRKKPLSFYASIGAIIFAVILGSYAAYRVSQKTDTPQPLPVSLVDHSQPSQEPPKGLEALPDFKPVVENHPETAPAYAHLLQVKSAPTLAGCIKSKNSCKCYTAQATPYPATYLQCLEHVMNLHFNPYASPSAPSVVSPANDHAAVKQVSADSSGLIKGLMSEPVQQISEVTD